MKASVSAASSRKVALVITVGVSAEALVVYLASTCPEFVHRMF